MAASSVALVSQKQARPSLATDTRSLCDPRLRNHAPTNSSEDGPSLLQPLDETFPLLENACKSRYPSRSKSVGRFRLLLARSQASRARDATPPVRSIQTSYNL